MRVLRVLLALATTPFLASVSQAQASEFTGTIEAIAAPNLTVAGRTVVTDARTEIEGLHASIGLADLHVGDVVEVEGTRQADGSVLAQEIQVQTVAPPPPPGGVGTITGMVFFGTVWSPTAPGVLGGSVQLTGTVSQTITADFTGHFTFTGLPAGTYSVCLVPPTFLHQTFPANNGCYTATLGGTVFAVSGLNFGVM
jgi:hypothetical protein